MDKLSHLEYLVNRALDQLDASPDADWLKQYHYMIMGVVSEYVGQPILDDLGDCFDTLGEFDTFVRKVMGQRNTMMH